MKRNTLLLVAGAAALLAGCGGSPSVEITVPPPVQQPTDQVPPGATASSAALVDFLKGLARSDSAEPLRMIGALVLPTSETEEPRPL